MGRIAPSVGDSSTDGGASSGALAADPRATPATCVVRLA